VEDAKPNKTGPENANVGPSGLRAPAKLGVLRVMAGLSRQHTANTGTIFADSL